MGQHARGLENDGVFPFAVMRVAFDATRAMNIAFTSLIKTRIFITRRCNAPFGLQ